jgi:DNA modification methylase
MAEATVAAGAVPLAELMPATWNPRTITDERFRNLCRSIQADPEFLWRRPVLAQADGTIYAGNMRHRAAQHLGLETIPAIVEDVSDQLARERALRDNAQWGEWEEDELAALLADLKARDADLDLLGFDDNQLQDLLNRLTPHSGLTDPDDAPPLPVEPVTQPGDLWLLGDHRVLCGDATNGHHVSFVMDGQRAACLWTDPPYGVDYEGGTEEHLTIANDGADGLPQLLLAAFRNADAVMAPGAVYYIAHPDVFAYEFAGAVRAAGWVQARPAVVLWIKDRLVLGRGDYHSRSEPLLYGWKPGAAHRPVADRSEDNVWECARPSRSEEHPTMKPVALVARALKNSTRPGEVVLDPFLGSGSTLIACEQLERRCCGLELDPRYCDVVVKRWEEFAGKKAEKAKAPEPGGAEAMLGEMARGKVVL